MLTRRDFFESLAVVSLGVAVPTVFGKAVVAAAQERADASVSGKTLVVVQLAGGVDGLNTVIYHNDPAYRQNRTNLAIAEKDMHVIDDRVAFHPSLGKLKDLFDKGKVAVIEGVGYPNPNYSHFRAMDIWQSADPEGAAKEGWLGRYFDGLTDTDGHPLAGLNVGRSLPSAFESQKFTPPSVADIQSFGLQDAAGDKAADQRRSSLLRLYDVYKPANTPFAALLDTTLESAYKSATDLKTADSVYKPAVTYPQSSLASGLRLLAELIDSGGAGGNPLRVGQVTYGGFDTHTNEANTLTRLLGDTSDALSAFWQDIEAHGHDKDVLVMTWSEFGRRVKENGQNGTDHGSAAPMFLLGGSVKGGFYGDPPSLTNLDNGNLRFTTDFRSVYATILEQWLQAPADTVLGKRFDQLKLLTA